MLKLIATNGNLQLFQTGFTTLFEGTALEETFPSGYLLNEVGEQIPVPNLLAAIRSPYWSVLSDPDEPVGKGRKRQFATRAEAARYAANIRWGNRGNEDDKNRFRQNELPIESTDDINEAILTGKAYAPFLPENFPPEIKEALGRITYDSSGIIQPNVAFSVASDALSGYYMDHMDPSRLSPEAVAHLQGLVGEGKIYYQQFLTGRNQLQDNYGIRHRAETAKLMARHTIMRQAEGRYIDVTVGTQVAKSMGLTNATPEEIAKLGREATLKSTRDLVASPNKRIGISIHQEDLTMILKDGQIRNQFDTNTSNGMLHQETRAAHEAVTFGVHPATTPTRRPVYGNFYPLGIQANGMNGSYQYGPIRFVLKSEVHDRSTFSAIDSLGAVRTAASITKPIQHGQADPFRTHSKAGTDRLADIAAGRRLPDYSEAQIHGGVSLKDVAYLAVDKPARISAESKRLLEAAGIPILRIDDGPPISDTKVFKSVDGIRLLIFEAVQKAKSFGGNRSAAGAYAAHIRWGSRTTTGATPESRRASITQLGELFERQGEQGHRRRSGEYEYTTPEGDKVRLEASGSRDFDKDSTWAPPALVGNPYFTPEYRLGTQSVRVDAYVNGKKVGYLDANELKLHGHSKNLSVGKPTGEIEITHIAVTDGWKRKGIATAMLTAAERMTFEGKKIVHSTALTDNGAAWAAATKSADAMHLDKTRSFGGNRSAAGEYAARIRWGVHSAADKERFKALKLDDAQLEKNITEGEKIGDDIKETLSISEQAALIAYQVDSRNINYFARNGEFTRPWREDEAKATREIEALDGLMERIPAVSEDVLVVKGIKLRTMGDSTEDAKTRLANMKVGQSFVDNGYLSASSLKTPSDDFDGPVRIEVVIPKGARALPVVHMGEKKIYKGEMEWLLPRKMRYRVIEVRHGDFEPTNEPYPSERSRLPQGKPVTIRVVAEPA